MPFFSWQTCHNSGLKDLQESSKDPSESVFGVEKTGEASLWNYFTNTNLTVQRMKKSSKDPSESVLYMEKKQERQVFGTISPTQSLELLQSAATGVSYCTKETAF